MPICKIDEFSQKKAQIGKLFGLDVGKKTIGIAIADANWTIASPLCVLRRGKFTADMTRLAELAAEHHVHGLIIGWPLNMDGSQGPRCDSVRDFTHALLRLHDMPVLFHDERLSTAGAERGMLEADLTRKQRDKRRDALAATWILQSALDAMTTFHI